MSIDAEVEEHFKESPKYQAHMATSLAEFEKWFPRMGLPDELREVLEQMPATWREAAMDTARKIGWRAWMARELEIYLHRRHSEAAHQLEKAVTQEQYREAILNAAELRGEVEKIREAFPDAIKGTPRPITYPDV